MKDPNIIRLVKYGKETKCQRCGYIWPYTGKNQFFCCCPMCRTTVTILRKPSQKKRPAANHSLIVKPRYSFIEESD
jgi:hypothetical protein